MITREDIRELAQLQCIEDEEGCALSFEGFQFRGSLLLIPPHHSADTSGSIPATRL